MCYAHGQGLSLSYARFFAEFLNEGFLDHLRLLASSTCVGLRYGYQMEWRTAFLVTTSHRECISIPLTKLGDASPYDNHLVVPEY